MYHPRDFGGGQQVDHLAPGARARRIQHGDIGAPALTRQCPPHRIGDHLTCGMSVKAARAARDAARELSTVITRPDSPTASASTAAKTPTPP